MASLMTTRVCTVSVILSRDLDSQNSLELRGRFLSTHLRGQAELGFQCVCMNGGDRRAKLDAIGTRTVTFLSGVPLLQPQQPVGQRLPGPSLKVSPVWTAWDSLQDPLTCLQAGLATALSGVPGHCSAQGLVVPFHILVSCTPGAARNIKVKYNGIAAPVCAFRCYLANSTFFSPDAFWKTPAFLSLTLIRILITPIVSFNRHFIMYCFMGLYLREPT